MYTHHMFMQMESNIFTNVWRKLRKFGLEYDDYPTIIENIAFLLRTITIKIIKTPTKSIDVIFYIMTTTSIVFYCYVYVFSTLWLVFFRYGKTDIISSAVAFALGSCSCSCLTKIAFMKLYSKEIKKIVTKYLKCDSRVIPKTRFANNLRKKLRVVKKRALIIWVSLVCDAAVYLARPLIAPGRHFSVDLYLLYGLEPMFETPNYQIATLLLTVSTGFAAYSAVTVAIFVIIIAGYNEAQLYALGVELKNVWDDSRNFYNHIKYKITDKRQAVYIKRKVMNEFIRIRLRDIIKFQTVNVDLVREFNEELRPFFAVEYIIMVFSIITDLLGGLEHTYLVLPFTAVLIYINCLAGQRLIDASDDFERSLYDCQWENFNTSNQKTVWLMLMISQKTLGLSAGGVTKLNYNCLMVILKSSYSIYTTLRSTVKKHQTQ